MKVVPTPNVGWSKVRQREVKVYFPFAPYYQRKRKIHAAIGGKLQDIEGSIISFHVVDKWIKSWEGCK
jgi:hypothetical protein